MSESTFETKTLPHGYAAAAVPYSDTTHLDRETTEEESVEESAQPKSEDKPTGAKRATGTPKTGD